MEYRTKSIFEKYTRQLQVLLDTNIDKFKVPFFSKYFGMGAPQVGLTYATVIGKARIEAAASVVAHGSEAPLRGRAGLQKLEGEIAALKVKRKFDEQDWREYEVMKALNTADEAKKAQIIQYIWNDVKYVIDSISSRLDIMVAQALSTGTIPINITTNPDGVVPGTVDLLVPAKRKSTRSGFASFSDNASALGGGTWAEPSGVPISNIRELTQEVWNEEGLVYDKVLMTPAQWWNVLKTTEVTTQFDGRPSLDVFNSFMQAQDLPIVEIVNVRAKVEKDGVLTSVNTWEDNKYVTFVPEGQLGTIHNALAVEQMRPVQGVDYATNSNILVSKWSQTEPFGEFTRGEISAFPGLEIADTMYILDVIG